MNEPPTVRSLSHRGADRSLQEDMMLKLALVGCGQIAGAHFEQICKVRSAELVGVRDRQIDLARRAGARFGIPRVFDDMENILETSRPDVLHATTPPYTHQAIAPRH